MHGRYGNPRAGESEIGGHFQPGKDKIVLPYKWVKHFRLFRPLKADVEFAIITGKDERTARRYLVGEHEPPGAIVAALVAELFEREGE